MGYFLKSDIMGLSLVLGLGCGISDNLVKAAAVCLLSLVSLILGGKTLSMLPAAAPGCQWKI